MHGRAEQIRPLAVKSRTRDELVEAYLQLAKSPPLAISLIHDGNKDPKALKMLCQALARHGHLDEALQIADKEQDSDLQSSLRRGAALGAAKAGRIGDTERAVEQLTASRTAEETRQGIWTSLALALIAMLLR